MNDQPFIPILPGLEELWLEAGAIWDRFHERGDFFNFVASDYRAVYQLLAGLQGQAGTVLEWGSGLGVVAIMAARLGFQAYGIEIEPRLVDLACGLADKYDAHVEFALGSYVPGDYTLDAELVDADFRTSFDDEPAYGELDMELRDFDIVFVYPWPNERALHQDIMRRCGGPHSLFVTFDVREGLTIERLGQRR
jgi:hypothetical protein